MKVKVTIKVKVNDITYLLFSIKMKARAVTIEPSNQPSQLKPYTCSRNLSAGAT